MADFSGYENLDAAGAAIQGLLQGMQQGEEVKLRREERDENRKFREMELNARMKSDAESKARQSAIDTYTKEKDSADRELKERELRIKERTDRAPSDPFGLKSYAADKAKTEYEERQRGKTPQGRVEKLSGEQRKRFDDTTGALDALIDIDSAVAGLPKEWGSREAQMIDVPLRGGTPFTIGRDQFIESLGRLQSGGAITSDEVNNFKKLIPSPLDKPEIAQKKLADLKFRLGARLKSFGMSPEEAAAAGFLKPSTAKGLMAPQGIMNQESASNTKVINGVTYKRVPGGWAEVPMSAGR